LEVVTMKGASLPARAIHLYLRVAWILFWVAAVILLIAVPTGLVRLDAVDDPPSLTVPVEIHLDPADLQGDGSGLAVLNPRVSESDATIRFGIHHRPAWILYGLVIYGVLVAIGYGLWLVRAVVRDVMASRAFTRLNATRLRRIGLLVLGWQLLTPPVQLLWSHFVLTRFDLDRNIVSAPLPYDLERIVLAIAVLVLAELFGEAARLQEERDLTV
jgi:hypothetical protein